MRTGARAALDPRAHAPVPRSSRRWRTTSSTDSTAPEGDAWSTASRYSSSQPTRAAARSRARSRRPRRGPKCHWSEWNSMPTRASTSARSGLATTAPFARAARAWTVHPRQSLFDPSLRASPPDRIVERLLDFIERHHGSEVAQRAGDVRHRDAVDHRDVARRHVGDAVDDGSGDRSHQAPRDGDLERHRPSRSIQVVEEAAGAVRGPPPAREARGRSGLVARSAALRRVAGRSAAPPR